MRHSVFGLVVVLSAIAVFLGNAPITGEETVEEAAKAELSVAIAAPERFGKRNINAGETLNVVVTNATQRDVRLWREWCSWGYFQLTLVIRDAENEDAQPVILRKKPRIWTKNYPDFWTLGPGEPLVWPVKLESGDWDLGPLEGKLRGRKFAVKAVLSCGEDDASLEKDVWSGSVTSAERVYHVN